MLQIGRQDETDILRWIDQNKEAIGIGNDEGRKGLAMGFEWLPLVVSFLGGIVQLNNYVGGLAGLLDKSQKIMDWLKKKGSPTTLGVGERVLGFLLRQTAQDKTANIGEIAGIVGATPEDVERVLTKLSAAGIVAKTEPSGWAISYRG